MLLFYNSPKPRPESKPGFKVRTIMGLTIMSMHAVDSFKPQYICPSLMLMNSSKVQFFNSLSFSIKILEYEHFKKMK